MRILSIVDYGIYSYALNIYSIFYMFSGLGMGSATLQLCSEKSNSANNKEKIFSYGFWLSVGINFILGLALIVYAHSKLITVPGSQILLSLFAILIPLTIIYEMQQTFLRCRFENQKFSYFTTINSALVLGGSVIGAILSESKGLIWGRIAGYIVTIIIGFFILKVPIPAFRYLKELSRYIKKDMLKIGMISMLNIATGQLLYLLDVFVIGQIIKDSTVIAGYKVATIIPDALLFIPTSLMIYYFPLFSGNKDNPVWVKKTYEKILIIFGFFNFILTIFCILFSKMILGVIFGRQYITNASIFCILMLAYFFSATFRKVTGNILVTQRKLKMNFFIGISEGLLNIVLNYYLVIRYGAIGAAIATLCVAILSGLIGTFYLSMYLKKRSEVK